MAARGRHEPVTVFETSDPAALAVAKSLLESAGVPFFAKGEAIATLIGFAAGPVELEVAEDDAAFAREVLMDLTGDSNRCGGEP